MLTSYFKRKERPPDHESGVDDDAVGTSNRLPLQLLPDVSPRERQCMALATAIGLVHRMWEASLRRPST